MRLDFLRPTASSTFLLPVSCALALGAWFALPYPEFQPADATSYGVWQFIPTDVTHGEVGRGMSLLFTALAVYFMAELNNAHVLLRISSRMLSSMLAILTGTAAMIHSFCPGHVVLVTGMAGYFLLFAMYQCPSPILTLLLFTSLSAGSLSVPPMLCLIPAMWICQGYLRGMTMRCLVASILGVLLPYWLWLGTALCTDTLPEYIAYTRLLVDFRAPDFSFLTLPKATFIGLLTLILIMGTIDLFNNSFKDKTRTRTIYRMVVIHYVAVLILIALSPQYIDPLTTLLLIDTAIIGGHHIALNYNQITHYYSLLLTALFIVVIVLWKL